MLTDTELIVHVTHSNAIEGEDAMPGDPKFDDHLTAAQLVAREAPRRIIMPREIHSVVMRNVLSDSGEYRNGAMMVGNPARQTGRMMPRPECLPTLMANLEAAARRRLAYPDAVSKTKYTGAVFHHEGLCIHPFTDGNGRTFRLFWCAIRLHLNLSWRIICATGRPSYFREIRMYEDRVFRPQHPEVY